MRIRHIWEYYIKVWDSVKKKRQCVTKFPNLPYSSFHINIINITTLHIRFRNHILTNNSNTNANAFICKNSLKPKLRSKDLPAALTRMTLPRSSHNAPAKPDALSSSRALRSDYRPYRREALQMLLEVWRCVYGPASSHEWSPFGHECQLVLSSDHDWTGKQVGSSRKCWVLREHGNVVAEKKNYKGNSPIWSQACSQGILYWQSDSHLQNGACISLNLWTHHSLHL